MSSNLKVNSLVPATGTEIGIGTTGGSIDFRCAATFGGNVTIGGTLTYRMPRMLFSELVKRGV